MNLNEVATQEADDRMGLSRQMGVGKLADCAGLDGHGLARIRVHQLRPYVPAAAEVHALPPRAFAEQRRRDVADTHHLVDECAGDRFDVIAHRRNAAAWLATGDDVRERFDVFTPRLQPVRKVLRERRRGEQRVEDAGAHAEQDAVRVARPEGDHAGSDSRQHEIGVAGDERPRAERRQHAVVVMDSGRVVGARADGRPHLDVAWRESEHARRARRAAGLVNALDALFGHAEVGAEGRQLVDRLLEVCL